MIATEPSALALFWVAVIGMAILAYVVLDGFDLGVGILFGATKDEALRDEMIASISPFWDGNETWLIVVGATLFAAFPAVYAVFLGAFYIPVLLLLLALIFRGVAFEFRARGTAQGFWDRSFAIGSLVAAFVQGAAVGAMLKRWPMLMPQQGRSTLSLGRSPGLRRSSIIGCCSEPLRRCVDSTGGRSSCARVLSAR